MSSLPPRTVTFPKAFYLKYLKGDRLRGIKIKLNNLLEGGTSMAYIVKKILFEWEYLCL